jgi:putative DNA primase/helicase
VNEDFDFHDDYVSEDLDIAELDEDEYQEQAERLDEQAAAAVASPRELPSPSNPMAVARFLMPAWQRHTGLVLRHWRGAWMRWEGPHWIEIDNGAMRADLYPRTEHAIYKFRNQRGEEQEASWAPTSAKINNLMEAIAAITHLPSEIEPPAWLAAPDPAGTVCTIVACRNGLLEVEGRNLMRLTPMYFNRVSVPFDYEPDAPEPVEWLNFLNLLWPDDPQAIAALQEWFGYIVSGRTDQQKILLMIGPRRSGKGTIGRILTALIGKDNTAGPTLVGLGMNFGLSTLIGKSLALVSDARLPKMGTEIIVERLLAISGEDTLDVDRKYRDLWTGRIPARFMILSNELPAFNDASGAIASRLVILTMENSFLGKEDKGLEGKLLKELPGIFNWALDGLDRLAKRGYFQEPESSATAVETLAATVSPINAFVVDRCTVGRDHSVSTDALFAAWQSWCDLDGRTRPGTKVLFGRNLLAAVPGLKRSRLHKDGQKVPHYVGLKLGVEDDK